MLFKIIKCILSNKRIYVIVAVILCAVILSLFYFNKRNNNFVEDKQQDFITIKSPNKPFIFDWFEYSIKKISCFDEINWKKVSNDNVYCIVEYSIKNISNENYAIWGDMVIAAWWNQNHHNPYINYLWKEVLWYINHENEPILRWVSLDTYQMFSIPKDDIWKWLLIILSHDESKSATIDLSKMKVDTNINENVEPQESSNISTWDEEKRLNSSYDLISFSYPSYFKVDTWYLYDNTLHIKKYSMDEYIKEITINHQWVWIAELSEQEFEDFISKESLKYRKLINDFLDNNWNFTWRHTYWEAFNQLWYEKIKVDWYDWLLTHYYEYMEELGLLRTELILFVNDSIYSFIFQYKFSDAEDIIERDNKCNSYSLGNRQNREPDCGTIINEETYVKSFFTNQRKSLKWTTMESFEDNYNIIKQVIDSIQVKK